MRRLLLCAALAAAPAPLLATPLAEVARANRIARVEPRADAYANAAQVFVYSEAALYQIYAAPERITDLALQPGERLVATDALAAGDTARWVIGHTVSGAGEALQTHILIKPTQPGLRTNLFISTDRRTYHLELRATTGPFLAAARWRYPADEARAAAGREAVRRAAAEPAKVADRPPASLNFDYRIQGRASWRPVRVYDDGRQTFIEFPLFIAQNQMPPLFLSGAAGELALVNYRVQGRRIIVDRLFDRAELRLRQGRRTAVVKLVRIGAAP